MKKAKKSSPKIKVEQTIIETYQVQCPHCKVFLRGGFNNRTLMFNCGQCKNPIKIDWDNAIEVKDF